MKYVIRWKSKVNGRAGKGTRQFDREEGEELVQELNQEYPDIEHELLETTPEPSPEPGQREAPSTSAQPVHVVVPE